VTYGWTTDTPTAAGLYVAWNDGDIWMRRLMFSDEGLLEEYRVPHKRGRGSVARWKRAPTYMCYMGPLADPPREMWEHLLASSRK